MLPTRWYAAVVTARNAPPASAAPPPAPNGQALVVANAAAAIPLMQTLERIGYRSSVAPDPYVAALELVRRPLVFRALVLSLATVYPEELELIDMIKRACPHIEVFLADSDGRPSAVEDATRRGAAALLTQDRLHRLGDAGARTPAQPPRPAEPATIEGVLSAEELRALLG